jgi:RNA polymerase sigma factor (sigma-70 family)
VERTARAGIDRRPIRGPKRLLALRADARLVELVRAGDDVAFEVLYERHVAGLLGFCRHMLGSQEEAEDAVQQAFVSAHGAIGRGSREIVFKPWLYTIARNRCLSILRARREHPVELPELSTAGLNEQVQQRADLRELLADLQRLPEQQRAALVLSELGDLSHAEVAEVIGHEPHAVKGLVFRARAALAERREARTADCGEIRLELAAATGGALRRGRLRYHLEGCPACTAYLDEVRRQRKLLGIALPVVPALALKDSVMGAAGIGAGAAGTIGAAGLGGAAATGAATTAGAATATGAGLLGGAAIKLAVAGVVLVGGAGVATQVAREQEPAPPVTAPSGGPASTTLRQDGRVGTAPAESRPLNGTAAERRRGQRGAQRRALGQQRARERSLGRSRAGEPPGARGLRRRAGRPGGGQGGKGVGQGQVQPGRPPDPGSRGGGKSGESQGQGGAKPSEPPSADTPDVVPKAAPQRAETKVAPPPPTEGEPVETD